MSGSHGDDDKSLDEGVVFVSHASEDKPVVKNLVDTLLRYGVQAWYDDYEIEIGDSIREKINEGLTRTEYGVIVLSHDFFAKKWPRRELAALSAILSDGQILPLFYQITPAEVAAHDPLLADVKGVAIRDQGDIREAVVRIARKVRGVAALEEKGLVTVFQGRTITVASLPLDESQAIHDTVFEDCILQGLAIIALARDRMITFDKCYFNSIHQFIVLQPPYAVVGAYGLRNVVFRRCRFKDVGFIATPDLMELFFANSQPMPDGTSMPGNLL